MADLEHRDEILFRRRRQKPRRAKEAARYTMTTIRRCFCDDLLRFASINRDHLTETEARDEDLKLGPIAERHFGLFNPDFTPVYDLGLLRQGSVAGGLNLEFSYQEVKALMESRKSERQMHDETDTNQEDPDFVVFQEALSDEDEDVEENGGVEFSLPLLQLV